MTQTVAHLKSRFSVLAIEVPDLDQPSSDIGMRARTALQQIPPCGLMRSAAVVYFIMPGTGDPTGSQ
jgi:hypothetical protein